MRVARVVLCGVLLSLALGCRRPEAANPGPEAADGPVWFRDATAEVGLNFVHEAGPIGRYFMPQIMGSGGATLDFDNDGRLDLYLVQNGGPKSSAHNRLFHQRKDGGFEDVSAGSGLDIAGHGMGVAAGDFDNDGWVDVYVSQYGGGRLFRNRGNGTFEDVTRSAGVEQPEWGTSCCFVDYDRDGWLDLVVVNYVDYDPGFQCGPANGMHDYCHPRVFPGTATRLFHNRGRDAGGRWLGFQDVTEPAGLAKRGPGLGVTCADFSGDGWPDIFVANDGRPNHLWINRRDGTFVDEAVSRGVAYNGLGQSPANMGVTLGRLEGSDGLSLFVTHLTEETHTLWQQTDRGFSRTGPSPPGWPAPTGAAPALARSWLILISMALRTSPSSTAGCRGRAANRPPSTDSIPRNTGHAMPSATSCFWARARDISATSRGVMRRSVDRSRWAGA